MRKYWEVADVTGNPVLEGISFHQGVGIFRGTLYQSVRKPQYCFVGYKESWRLLYHVHQPEKLLSVEIHYQKDGDKGGHNRALWTAFSFLKNKKKKDLCRRPCREPCVLDLDGGIYLEY